MQVNLTTIPPSDTQASSCRKRLFRPTQQNLSNDSRIFEHKTRTFKGKNAYLYCVHDEDVRHRQAFPLSGDIRPHACALPESRDRAASSISFIVYWKAWLCTGTLQRYLARFHTASMTKML